MKTPIFPKTNWKAENDPHLSIDDCEDVAGLARQLIDGHHPGVLTTVDRQGSPHARWMATTTFDNFPLLFTLTAPKSRKVLQIEAHPQVNWMFSNSDLSLVINLRGHAEILNDPTSLRTVWKAIEDKSHAFFLNSFAERPGVAVIKTTVEHIECCLPEANLHWEAGSGLLASPALSP